jgi:hypothetical protein
MDVNCHGGEYGMRRLEYLVLIRGYSYERGDR